MRGAWGVTPPILCYHKVDTRFELGFTLLGPRVFRRHIEALARAGYAGVGSESLLLRTAHHVPRTVCITFDDGYSGLAEHAFPVLADHGFKALVFVITDWVGRENTWDVQYGWRKFHHLDWDTLGRWQERGVEVHSHGISHARLTWLSDDAAAEELGRSREAIAARLGGPPAGISYPYGASDSRIRGLAVAAGYTLGFAGSSTSVAGDAMMMPRQSVYPWDAFGVPLVMRDGTAGSAARGLARFTNRCSVGTAAMQKLLGRGYLKAGDG